MMPEILRTLLPFLAASVLALATYSLTASLHFRPRIARGLQDFYATAGSPGAPSAGDQIGDQIARRLPFSLEAWEAHLKWAQRGGYFQGWGLGRLVFTSLVYGLAGGAVLLLNPAPTALCVPLAAAAYPFVSMRAKANTARKRVVRGLPEVAALVAAEMSAGTSPEGALQRASSLPGPLTGLLAEALAFARSAGRPLFGRKPVRGALVEVFGQAGLPELQAFATQLDLVAEKGVAGAHLMNEVARNLAREYRARLDSEVEKLNSRLMLATAVFFFIPFVLIILGSFMAPVLTLFG
jgi:tight adherence protein C